MLSSITRFHWEYCLGTSISLLLALLTGCWASRITTKKYYFQERIKYKHHQHHQPLESASESKHQFALFYIWWCSIFLFKLSAEIEKWTAVIPMGYSASRFTILRVEKIEIEKKKKYSAQNCPLHFIPLIEFIFPLDHVDGNCK